MSLKILLEEGLGETRAALVENDRIVQIFIERADVKLRAGDIWDGRLSRILVSARRGLVTIGGEETLIEPLPTDMTEGARLRVEVVREAISEPGRPRLPKVAALPEPPQDEGRVSAGSSLPERLRAMELPLQVVSPHGPDLLETAGWSEAIEAAHSGTVPFPDGLLTISLTPAMTVIDIDGASPPVELAIAGATAAAEAIRRLDITGSIGIDFPTVGDKSVRTRIGMAIDARLPRPFERTAVNGFGFLQIIRRRVRPSILELVQGAPVETAALTLLRRAERELGVGPRTIVATTAVIIWLRARPALIDQLARRVGVAVELREAANLPIFGGYVDVRPR